MTDDTLPAPRVAIIGAGLAGLTCATALKGFADVTVFEKAVFVGGRISRYQVGEFSFNHGGQYFTVSNPLFLNLVEAWQTSGLVRPWDGWIVELDNGQLTNLEDQTQGYTGYPHMQAITDSLAHHCDLKISTNISEIEKQDDGSWRLFDNRGVYQGLFDIVVIATAAPDVVDLAKSVESIARAASKIDMTMSWSALFVFERSLSLPFDAAFVLNSPLSWVARYQEVDPPAEDDQECWVIQASPEWSLQYAASFRGRVMHALLDAFFEACDITSVKPVTSNVHLWKHALPINTMGQDCLFDEDASLGACGDWCTSPRIEGAVLSGFSMADRVMKQVNRLLGPTDTI